MEKMYIDTDEDYVDSEKMLDNPASRPPQNALLWMNIAFRMLIERWGSWLTLSVFVALVEFTLDAAAGMLKVLWFFLPMATLLMHCGMQCAASAQEYDEEAPSIRHLFMPLEGKVFEFILFYALFLGVGFCAWLLFNGLGKHFGLLEASLLQANKPITLMLWAAFCLSLLGFVFWFAPALVFLRNENPFAAIGMSLKAGFKNILPFVVFFIVQYLLILALAFAVTRSTNITIIIVVTTVFFLFYQIFIALCCYAAYRDIWFEEQ